MFARESKSQKFPFQVHEILPDSHLTKRLSLLKEKVDVKGDIPQNATPLPTPTPAPPPGAAAAAPTTTTNYYYYYYFYFYYSYYYYYYY